MLELPIACLNERFCVQVANCRQHFVHPIAETVTRERFRPTFRFPKPMSEARPLHAPNFMPKPKPCQADAWEDKRSGKRESARLDALLIGTHKPYTMQQGWRI
jgi:hypothetical protein